VLVKKPRLRSAF